MSSRNEKVFHVKSDGWVSPTVGTPRPNNRAALQNAIDKASAWAIANDYNAPYYAALRLADVAWATAEYFDDTFMVGVPARSRNTDWVTPVAGQRVLVKDHTNPAKNGIYVIPSSGAWTRASDADSAAEFFRSQTNVKVLNGFHWKGTRWRLVGGYGLITTLDTDPLPWNGVPVSARAIVVNDGEPIYVDNMVDVKDGVQLALSGAIIGDAGAAVVEDLVVFRTNASAREQLRVIASYVHGGVRISHYNPDQRAECAPIEVLYVGARGAGARDAAEGPGSSTRPLHGFSAYFFPIKLHGVWTYGGDVGIRLQCDDAVATSLYALASGDGAWVRCNNSHLQALNIDTPSGVPLRIDASTYLRLQAMVATNTATPTDIVLIGDQLTAGWAQCNALDLALNTRGQGTNALHIKNCDGPSHIRLLQNAAVTTAVRVGANVTNRVHVDADLLAADAPHAFDATITVGPTISYRQAGAQSAIKSGGGSPVPVVAA